jgi:protein-S-isoprenylcysteine O-methyltransferase Ste14
MEGNMIGLLKAVLFFIGTLLLLWISWPSLRKPQSHGYYRFFAWEFILSLTMINIEVWFRDPFSIFQVISWVLLIISIFLVIHGVRLLKEIGKPDQNSLREETPVLSFEKTTSLVTRGAYRYIRHPLYASLFFLNWGVFFKDPSWVGIIIASAATLALVMTARMEEIENIRFFGKDYEKYIQKTKMFIPFLF